MKVYGALIAASLEPLAVAPTAGVFGRIYLDTGGGKVQVDDGTIIRPLLRNDQNLVFGNHATPANNVRANRAANSVLQFVLGSDATAEGALSTALAQLSFKFETYTNAAKPAPGVPGRVIYVSDLQSFQGDNGVGFVGIGGGAYQSVAQQSIAAGGTISLILAQKQLIPVVGSAGPQTTSVTPFGTGTFNDGYTTLLLGGDNTNTVTIPTNDAANGVIGNFESITLAQNEYAKFVYVSSISRFLGVKGVL